MSDNPVLAYRREAQEFFQSAEHLLAAALSFPGYTEDEVAMIGYYLAEIQKTLAVLTEKSNIISVPQLS